MKYPDLLGQDMARVGVQVARKYNLQAGILLTDVVKTAFGPRGLDKVYVDIQGDSTITKHGGAFLRKIDVDHPAAKAIIEGANAVDTNVGDGTITVAVLIGALLKKANELLDNGIPPAIITSGFEQGREFALEILSKITQKCDLTDRGIMHNLAVSCLQGKALFNMSSDDMPIVRMIIDAICTITNFPKNQIDIDNIKIEEKLGNVSDIQLINGIVIDKTIDNCAMPHSIENAKILLTNENLETFRTKTESEIAITSPEQMSLFLNQESNDLISKVRKIVDSDVNVVISRKGIDSLAQEYLAKAGIISMRRVKNNDLWWVEKATGAKTCKSLENISPDELGQAKKVYQKTVGDDKMVFIDGKNPHSVTLLLRANSKQYLDEFHRTALNVIYVLRNFIERPEIVVGGGSTEAILAHKISQRALEVEGKEQIVIQKFAEALEEIPITLARNVGMDTIDTLIELRNKLAKFSNGKFEWIGIDSKNRKVSQISQQVIEPVVVKEQIIKTGVEVTNMIMRVDDVFMQDLIDNTHCHIDGTVHAHRDGGKAHNHFEQEGLEQRQMHHYY
ncbi:MAG TPA: thermosome subunit alpha [Nitrosopumilaceae archaeon]|nr:thermosome subunit alpha [Nitrosopumilaceae archaeon]